MDPILAQLSTSLPAAKSIEQLTRPLLDMLGSVTGLESTYLTAIDLARDVQQVRYARNAGRMNIPEGLTVPWSDTLCKRALDDERMATNEVADCWGDAEAARRLGIQTYMSAPVRGNDGELLGTLCAASAERRPINDESQTLLRLFSNLVAGFIEREKLVKSLQQANEQLVTFALTDSLTGLPNRRAVFDQTDRLLAAASREHGSVLLAVVDLDGFKQINDRHGHRCGDIFLQEVSRRLQAAARVSEMVARIGGDEFLVVGAGPAMPGIVGAKAGGRITQGEPAEAAARWQERLTEATVGEFKLDDDVVRYDGASVGVVAVGPAGMSAQTAIREADELMYEVKRKRKAAIGETPRQDEPRGD